MLFRSSELRDGVVRTYEAEAAILLGDTFPIADLAGGSAEKNAAMLRGILAGSLRGGARAAVLLNAAAAIVAGEAADTLEQGIDLAATAIDSGAALGKLDLLIQESRKG